MTRLILGMPLEGKLRRYAETVDASASALMTIVNDVLDFSKMEAGKYTLHAAPFEPSLVVQEAVELHASRAHDKRLELVYRKASDVPALMVGDPDRYRQILNNLIGNAIKFTDVGEVFVEITLDEQDEESCVLRTVVQDSGIGIASGDMVKLFDAFSQVDGSSVRQHGGTGLGLAICKRLAEMMGGTIGVVSEKGVGSKFWFTVRLTRSESPARTAASSVPIGRRALVVEASRRWGRVIEEHFVAWGLPCDVIQDGQLALTKVKESESKPYDIVIVSAHLRDLSLAAFVRELRALPQGAGLPIIVLTQFGVGVPLAEVEKEVTAQVAKPLRLSELYECIAGVFSGTWAGEVMPRDPVQRGVQRRGRVLVVDDNDINQFVASEQLVQAGYEVDVAQNGQEAVAMVQQNEYAAVLMDCQMPIMDGYTATRAIREWEGSDYHIPIIALTAHAMAGERDKVLAAGMDDYLAKPLRAQVLERMLDRYITAPGPDSGAGAASVRPPQTVDLDMSIKRSAKLVQLFVSRVPDSLNELDMAISEADSAGVRARAHKLKGSCLALGALAMAGEAEALQHDAERGDLSQASVRTSTLWVQYDRATALMTSEADSESGARSSLRV
jgi:CheY-like chemotaxis protein/HPt (histidine-containing phosphotransfer) domain-containing protein